MSHFYQRPGPWRLVCTICEKSFIFAQKPTTTDQLCDGYHPHGRGECEQDMEGSNYVAYEVARQALP